MSFDLEDKRYWVPLFSRHLPSPPPLPSIQENSLSYDDPNHRTAMKLQDELTHHLKTSLRSWRRGLTKFRSEVSEKLYHVIELLELANTEGKHAKHSILDELYNNSGGKSMFGVPLHFSLLQKDDITKQVEATGVHLTKRPDAEFALAVRVFAYPCQVFSIWVFTVAF